MDLEVRKEGNIFIVAVVNERIDAQGADDFKEKMFAYISDGNYNIVLNISSVNFIDSSGLGIIVACLKQVKGKGQMVICCINDPIERMFRLTRMNKVFNLFATEEEAVRFFS